MADQGPRDPRTPRRPATARAAFASASALLTLFALGSCRATPGAAGSDRTILAEYSRGTLKADLPAHIRVPAVVAAAQAALRERGYAVTSSVSTEDSGSVAAAPPDAGFMERVMVTTHVTARGTIVEIRVEPWGDQARSRVVLDSILARLGL